MVFELEGLGVAVLEATVELEELGDPRCAPESLLGAQIGTFCGDPVISDARFRIYAVARYRGRRTERAHAVLAACSSKSAGARATVGRVKRWGG